MPGETPGSTLDRDTIRKLKAGADDVDSFYEAARQATEVEDVPGAQGIPGRVDDSGFQDTLRRWNAAAAEVDSEERTERARSLEEARKSLLGESGEKGEAVRGNMPEVVASADIEGIGEGADVLRFGDGSGVPSDNKSAASEKPITGEVDRGKLLGDGVSGENDGFVASTDVVSGGTKGDNRRQVSGLVAGFEERVGAIDGDVDLKVEIRQDIQDKIRELEEQKADAEGIEGDSPLKRMSIRIAEQNINDLLSLLTRL